MNVPVITVFVELTLLSVIFNNTWLTNAHKCDTIVDNGRVFENCSFRGLTINVPQDLNVGVTEIDLSGNVMKSLVSGNSGFDRYTKLEILIMRNMTPDSPFTHSDYLFRNMYTLEVIDFSSSFIQEYSSVVFKWPPNIRIIYFANNLGMTDLEVDNSKYLEKLYASNNSLQQFPKFHEIAKPTVIDLKYNPIRNLSTDVISNFCFLDHLNITLSKMDFCECKRLRLWLVNHHVKTTTPLNCESPEPLPNCDTRFTQVHLSNRRRCFSRGLSQNTTSNWYKILPFILIFVFSLLVPSYLYAKKYRAVQHKLHHPKTPKSITSAPALEEETTEAPEDNGPNGTESTS